MKTLPQIILTILIAATVAWGAVQFTQPKAQNEASVASQKSTTRLPEKIQCGYVVNPPYVIKDPQSGQLSGISYDIVQKISEEIGIPAEWTVESGYGTALTDLNYKKFDVFCSDLWINPDRARMAIFTLPAFYSPILAYVKADDVRFDHKTIADLASDNTLNIAIIDGEFSQVIQKEIFPSAQLLAEPQSTAVSQLLEDIHLGKADITFVASSVANEYMKANPDKIKMLAVGPLHLGESAWAFRKDESDLRDLFNVAIRKLNSNGYVDRVLRKYEANPGDFYRVAKPYEEVK